MCGKHQTLKPVAACQRCLPPGRGMGGAAHQSVTRATLPRFFQFLLTLVITTSPSFSHLHRRNFSALIHSPFIRDKIRSMCLSTFYKGFFDKRSVKNQSCSCGNTTAAKKKVSNLLGTGGCAIMAQHLALNALFRNYCTNPFLTTE